MSLSPLSRLSWILDILRRQCPWDSAQTLDSLRHLTIEEVYELSDAVIALSDSASTKAEEERVSDLKKELGDLLMHVLFYSKIADDRGLFDFDAVCTAVSDKLVSRHPHIALPLADGSLREPLTSAHPGWERVKMKEGRKSVFDGVSNDLPSLVKAGRLQDKAEGIGFPSTVSDLPQDKVSDVGLDEAGEMLFRLVAVLRRQGINADEALSHANQRFVRRVAAWEEERQA